MLENEGGPWKSSLFCWFWKMLIDWIELFAMLLWILVTLLCFPLITDLKWKLMTILYCKILHVDQCCTGMSFGMCIVVIEWSLKILQFWSTYKGHTTIVGSLFGRSGQNCWPNECRVVGSKKCWTQCGATFDGSVIASRLSLTTWLTDTMLLLTRRRPLLRVCCLTIAISSVGNLHY